MHFCSEKCDTHTNEHTHTPTIIFLFNMMFSINHKRSHLVFDYWWHRSHFSGLLPVPYCVHIAMDAERET